MPRPKKPQHVKDLEAEGKPEYWDAPVSPTKEERIHYLADLMAQGRFRTRLTARSLMVVWGLSQQTLDFDTSEASRLLRTPPEELQDRRDRWQAKVEAIVDMALTTKNKLTGLPDLNSALKAMEMHATFAGLAPKAAEADLRGKFKIEVVHSIEDDSDDKKEE